MSIIYPMGLMAIFTLLYSSLVVRSRVKALKAGDIKRSFFRTYDNDTARLCSKADPTLVKFI